MAANDDEYEGEPTDESFVVIDSTLLAPKVRITKSTADAVIAGLFPIPEDLLRRFELVKKMANYTDGERDGLRKYIQAHFNNGTYGSMIVYFQAGAEQSYANAEGKYALMNYLQTTVPRARPDAPGEAGMGAVILETLFDNPTDFLDEILRLGKDKALDWLTSIWVGEGIIQDNEALYSRKGSNIIKITEIPSAFNPPALK